MDGSLLTRIIEIAVTGRWPLRSRINEDESKLCRLNRLFALWQRAPEVENSSLAMASNFSRTDEDDGDSDKVSSGFSRSSGLMSQRESKFRKLSVDVVESDVDGRVTDILLEPAEKVILFFLVCCEEGLDDSPSLEGC